MAKKPAQPDTRKTFTELKKELRADDVIHARAIFRYFVDIARDHPEIVIEAINKRGAYLATLDDERKRNQVTYQADTAEYLRDLFDIK